MDFDDECELPIKSIAAKPAALDKLAAAWTIDFRPAAAALADDRGHRKKMYTKTLSPVQLCFERASARQVNAHAS